MFVDMKARALLGQAQLLIARDSLDGYVTLTTIVPRGSVVEGTEGADVGIAVRTRR